MHTLEFWKENDVLRTITEAAEQRIGVKEVTGMLFQSTNHCIAHAWGCCVNLECGYAHEEYMLGALDKYLAAQNVGQGKSRGKPPMEYSEFPRFKKVINDAFVYYTGAPVMNVRKSMIKKVIAGTPMKDCIGAMKVLRRFCERTIAWDDPMLGHACYILQDWEGTLKWKQAQ